jgi:hypothetical protein
MMRLPVLASSLTLLLLIGCTSQLSVRVPTLAGGASYAQDLDTCEFLVRQSRPHDRKVAEDEVVECYKISKNESTFGNCLGPRGYTIQRWDARYRR